VRKHCLSASALVVVLTACGGGSGGGNASGTNGLPPDPGAAGVRTVVGIDSNANGIRDDVEVQIDARYGTDPTAFAAATETAKVMQRALIISASDSAAVEAHFETSVRTASCLYQQLGRDAKKAGEIITRVHIMTFNTPERMAQWRSVSAAIGPRIVKPSRAC